MSKASVFVSVSTDIPWLLKPTVITAVIEIISSAKEENDFKIDILDLNSVCGEAQIYFDLAVRKARDEERLKCNLYWNEQLTMLVHENLKVRWETAKEIKEWIKEQHKEHKVGTCSVYACGLDNFIEKRFLIGVKE